MKLAEMKALFMEVADRERMLWHPDNRHYRLRLSEEDLPLKRTWSFSDPDNMRLRFVAKSQTVWMTFEWPVEFRDGPDGVCGYFAIRDVLGVTTLPGHIRSTSGFDCGRIESFKVMETEGDVYDVLAKFARVLMAIRDDDNQQRQI